MKKKRAKIVLMNDMLMMAEKGGLYSGIWLAIYGGDL
jgi:hypothetical protein